MEPKKLNRFTTLPVLLDLLKRKRLVLLDPAVWEDKNDSENSASCIQGDESRIGISVHQRGLGVHFRTGAQSQNVARQNGAWNINNALIML